MPPKPVIKKEKKAAESNLDSNTLKIFSGTTKSVEFSQSKFVQMNKNPNVMNKVGSYMFEIIAQLDSILSEDSSNGACEFSIKDHTGRMHCIFYQIDRKIEKISRDSWM
jgi:hypothetical protein